MKKRPIRYLVKTTPSASTFAETGAETGRPRIADPATVSDVSPHYLPDGRIDHERIQQSHFVLETERFRTVQERRRDDRHPAGQCFCHAGRIDNGVARPRRLVYADVYT